MPPPRPCWPRFLDPRSFPNFRLPHLDTDEEAAGVESAFGVEAILYGFHEGQGIAGSSPSVERGRFCRMMKQDEGTVPAFQFLAQDFESGVQRAWLAFETEPTKTRGVNECFPAELLGARGLRQQFDRVGHGAWQDADFSDGRGFRNGKRPKRFARGPR